MTLMMVATLTIILHLSSQISLYKLIYRSAATSNYCNAVSSKDISCPLTHIASQHHLNTHLVKHWCNARFASATLWRRHSLLANHLVVLNGINSIICTVAKMIVNHIISCWYRYFHLKNILIKPCKDTKKLHTGAAPGVSRIKKGSCAELPFFKITKNLFIN